MARGQVSLKKQRVNGCKKKHRPGTRNARCIIGVGNGRVRFLEFYTEKWTSTMYSTFLYSHVEPALEDMKWENGGAKAPRRVSPLLAATVPFIRSS